MAWLKLPPRAFTFAQMKYWPLPVDENNADYVCGAHQTDCSIQAHFPSSARILQWSWFGKVSQPWVTPEALIIMVSLVVAITLLCIPVRLLTRKSDKAAFGKKQNLMSTGIRKGLCKIGF